MLGRRNAFSEIWRKIAIEYLLHEDKKTHKYPCSFTQKHVK
jgi:hypothetical protein